jgi:hypothetical protein
VKKLDFLGGIAREMLVGFTVFLSSQKPICVAPCLGPGGKMLNGPKVNLPPVISLQLGHPSGTFTLGAGWFWEAPAGVTDIPNEAEGDCYPLEAVRSGLLNLVRQVSARKLCFAIAHHYAAARVTPVFPH